LGSRMQSANDDLVTPFEVEREMVELNRHIDAAPNVIRDHHNKVRDARKKYKRAYNIAFCCGDGTQLDRKAQAELSVQEEQDALDVAEVEYRYVSDLLDAYKTKLRALQSISSLMKAQMFQGNSS
jgi:hypothetical protein